MQILLWHLHAEDLGLDILPSLKSHARHNLVTGEAPDTAVAAPGSDQGVDGSDNLASQMAAIGEAEPD